MDSATSDQSPSVQKPEDPFHIVGVGASAGGLAALRQFFSHVPENSGLVFVVVVHLSPDHESHLSELLQPHAQMPVQQVSESVKMERNHVYIIPPNANLDAIDTHLRLSDLEDRQQGRAPIDHFFRTLASTHDGNAIGVILTGTGSDGALGVREIKQRGGVCIVQDPAEAEHRGMPQSALATGAVDLALPVARIPEAIHRISQTRPRLPQIRNGETLEGDAKPLLQAIFTQLRTRTGRDFSNYKRATMLRRIERRMQLRQIEELSHYLDLLRHDSEELSVLGDDLLITVTSFLRDSEVFQNLERDVIPQLFDGKGNDDELRAWSVGCATGEEAYSLAILLYEEASRRDFYPRIQIFASDIHEHSLQRARDGFYPSNIEGDVAPERLKRFFLKQNGGYRICKELREMVVFASHNLLNDPPFTRLDLISCRNLLIYLQRHLQNDIIELFHHALKPNGYLVLGTSEMVNSGDLFRAEDKKCSIYHKRNVPASEPRLPVYQSSRLDLSGVSERLGSAEETIAYGAMHQRMVERFAPPSVLLSPDDRIVHLSEHAGRYLLTPGGEPTVNVSKLVRKELQLELQAALQIARNEGKPVESKPVPVRFNGDEGVVTLYVSLSHEPSREGFALVIFQERQKDEIQESQQALGHQELTMQSSASEREQKLQAELQENRHRLQAFIEEYETSRQAMRRSNEEMQSTNEELRSTLEELEASKEELQSLNEELQTVNQENRHKVEELSQLSGDLQNLMAATEIATLFLDRELRILRFTPKIGDLFNVRPSDRSRSISDFSHRLGYDQLLEDAQGVLNSLIPVDREIEDESGRWYLTRVMPYRSADDRIEGVVITFVDITDRRRIEDDLRDSRHSLAVQLEASQRLQALSTDLFQGGDTGTAFEEVIDIACMALNADCASLHLLEADSDNPESVGMLRLLAHRGFHPYSVEFWERVEPHSTSLCGFVLARGQRIHIEDIDETDEVTGGDLEAYRRSGIRAAQSTPLFTRSGRLLGTISTYWLQPCRPSPEQLARFDLMARQVGDLFERLQLDEELCRAKQYAEAIIETLHEPLLVLQPDLSVKSVNSAFYQQFQTHEADTIGRKIYDLGNSQWDIPALRELLEDVLPESNNFNEFEVTQDFEDIGKRTMLLNARRLDHLQLILLGVRDITRSKQAEREILENEQRLSAIIEQLPVGVGVLNADNEFVLTNSRMKNLVPQLSLDSEQEQRWRWFDNEGQAFSAEHWPGISALQDAGISGMTFRFTALDGEKIWELLSAAPFRDFEGNIIGAVVAAQNITDRQQAEQALRESEERLRLAARMAGFGTYYGNVRRREVTYSPELLQILGKDSDQPMTLGIGEIPELIHEDDRDRVRLKIDDSLDPDGDGRFQDEYRIVRPDGEIRWILMQGRTVFKKTKNGQLRPVRVAGVALDITRRHRFEQEIREAHRMAEAANEAKSIFLANMSHELRTPMTAILGYTDILGSHLDDKDAQNYLRTIQENGNYLCELLNDILDLSKIESGKLVARPEKTSIVEILADIRSLMTLRASQKNLELRIELDGKFPRYIETDRKMFRQILFNLVGNAIKFTEQGSVCIRATCLPDSQMIEFSVVDTGIGIRQDQFDQLFQPFQQLDNSLTRVAGGSGLGLVISKKLVEKLGGELQVESRWGEGSTFRFTLRTGPLDAAVWIEPDSGSLRDGIEFEADALPRLTARILAVDDREDIQLLLSDFIQSAGGEIIVRSNGAECVQMWIENRDNQTPIDVILVDIQMPVMDGLEATRRLRSEGYRGPIIALTASAMRRDKDKCLEAGCDDFISKPINRGELIRNLARWSDHSNQEQHSDLARSKPDVLIVDDNAAICSTQKILLEKHGFRVETALSGEEALATVDTYIPDVALLDMGLKGLSGSELLDQLKLKPGMENCRFFCFTGRDEADVDWRGMGFDSFLRKPTDVQLLVQVLTGQ